MLGCTCPARRIALQIFSNGFIFNNPVLCIGSTRSSMLRCPPYPRQCTLTRNPRRTPPLAYPVETCDYAGLVRELRYALIVEGDEYGADVRVTSALNSLQSSNGGFRYRAEKEYFLAALFNAAKRRSPVVFAWLVHRWFLRYEPPHGRELDPEAIPDLALPDLAALPRPVDLEALRRRIAAFHTVP